MRVRVQFYSHLRDLAGLSRRSTSIFRKESTVADLLETDLRARFRRCVLGQKHSDRRGRRIRRSHPQTASRARRLLLMPPVQGAI